MTKLLCFIITSLLCFNAYADRLYCSSWNGGILGEFDGFTTMNLGRFITADQEILFSFTSCQVVRDKK